MSYEDKNFRRFVSDDRFIGKGAFGEVYGPCDWDGKICAIKKRWLKKEDTEKELSACGKWMSLRHKSLITVYDVSLEPHAVYMSMEYASGGSLYAVLSERKSDFPLEILKDWGIQIAEGMAYLHGNNIVHRDLKSPNILIMEADASTNPYNKTLKITDFDQIREYDGTKTMTYAGTNAWAAPEVLALWKFSKASDVWSYGVVLWEILTRDVPYKGVADQLIAFKVPDGQLKLEIPDSCPDIVRDFLNRCLSNDKDNRPSFDNIILLPELQRYPINTVALLSDGLQHLGLTVGDHEYTEKNVLGQGMLAKVYKGRSTKDLNMVVAVKDVGLNSLIVKRSPDSPTREIEILKKQKDNAYFVLEFGNGGTLREYLQRKQTLNERTIRTFLQQIAGGLKAAHEMQIIHCDLKPENIRLCFSGPKYPSPDRITLKIGGFGIGEFLNSDEKARALCGTSLYMAPEMILQRRGGYEYKADLWSVGVIAYECLVGSLPKNSIIALHGAEVPTNISPEFANLLNGLLENDENKRFNMKQFFNHQFLADNMSVCVAGPDNYRKIIQVKDNQSVDHLMDIVCAKYNTDSEAAFLVYEDGRTFERGSGNCLRESGIVHNSTVTLVLRLSGGSDNDGKVAPDSNSSSVSRQSCILYCKDTRVY